MIQLHPTVPFVLSLDTFFLCSNRYDWRRLIHLFLAEMQEGTLWIKVVLTILLVVDPTSSALVLALYWPRLSNFHNLLLILLRWHTVNQIFVKRADLIRLWGYRLTPLTLFEIESRWAFDCVALILFRLLSWFSLSFFVIGQMKLQRSQTLLSIACKLTMGCQYLAWTLLFAESL